MIRNNLIKLSKWFKTRKRMREEIHKLITISESILDEAVGKIEQLDQDKIYTLNLEGCSPDELHSLKLDLRIVQKRMRWTMPEIVIINRPMEELDEIMIERLYKKIKNKKETDKK